MSEAKIISEELVSEIKEKVNEADKVVVGIGLDWMTKVESADSFPDVLIDEKEHEKYKELYSKLKTMLSGKDYYILTLCYDDLIYMRLITNHLQQSASASEQSRQDD